MAANKKQQPSMLVVRLGAMGDIIHTLPAVGTLKKSFPDRRLVWVIARKWAPLLEGNPYIDELIAFDRGNLREYRIWWRRLRDLQDPVAFDFQGLLQSALIGRAARPQILYGFDRSVAREPWASFLYTESVMVKGPHRIQRNVQLAQAAGASVISYEAWIPAGKSEGALPSNPFVLACPSAGWPGKEWPLENYELLGRHLAGEGLTLVANVPLHRVHELRKFKNVQLHSSGLSGLIAATRAARAIVGLDSGPLHLAAALRKPGVALFGPTDPLRTGPFGGTMEVLRTDDGETTYKRHSKVHASMQSIRVEKVLELLRTSIAASDSGALKNETARVTVPHL